LQEGKLFEADHRPVMLQQVVAALRPRPGARFIDATVGLGGHAAALLEASSPDGQLLGIDCDARNLQLAAGRLERYGNRVKLVHGWFADLPHHLQSAGWASADGLLADLGISSRQLAEAERGLSFQQAGPLDMRLDQSRGPTLRELLERSDEKELARVLADFGEVRSPRVIARHILRALGEGKLTSTLELARYGSERLCGRRHPATRVFQALRIWVNGELEQLEKLLSLLPWPLLPGGRAAIISFHSLEDRLVKRRFSELCGRRDESSGPARLPLPAAAVARLVYRRALRPAAEETASNPRARSARLRVIERLAS
jgi:16S rRNA (cytosine1402-N4)-methyltransferase